VINHSYGCFRIDAVNIHLTQENRLGAVPDQDAKDGGPLGRWRQSGLWQRQSCVTLPSPQAAMAGFLIDKAGGYQSFYVVF